ARKANRPRSEVGAHEASVKQLPRGMKSATAERLRASPPSVSGNRNPVEEADPFLGYSRRRDLRRTGDAVARHCAPQRMIIAQANQSAQHILDATHLEVVVFVAALGLVGGFTTQ